MLTMSMVILGEPFVVQERLNLSYMEAGLYQGRRDDLTGGGLTRSLCRWSEVKRIRLKDQDNIMSDERVLGEYEFVSSALSEANEKIDRRYELKSRGYDLGRIAERVAEIYGKEQHEVFSKRSAAPKSLSKEPSLL